MQGATYYYYGIPKNPVNDWLVAEHQKRFHSPPDFFTAGGMSAAMAVVAAIEKTGGKTDTETLIPAMEGMGFDTPKGKMIFRKEDHQALQSMYAFRIKVEPDVAWAVPELTREITHRRHADADPEQAVSSAGDPRPDRPLRRSGRGERRFLRVRARHAHRDRRAERRGEDDLFQPDLRPVAGERGRRVPARRTHHPSLRAQARAARARTGVPADQPVPGTAGAGECATCGAGARRHGIVLARPWRSRART